MSKSVYIKNVEAPPFCEKEILRYAGCMTAEPEMLSLMQSAIAEIQEALTYKVCYRTLPVRIQEKTCDFGCFTIESKNLAQNLQGCARVILFAATIGVGIDRQIARYSRIAPSKAVMLQAIGAERIESLCDAFCEEMKTETGENLRPRFSPGYGDLSLEAQKEIFSLLDPAKRIGLTLRDSLIMSPSKSVTAFVGVGDGGEAAPKCRTCNKTDCMFRGVK